MVSCAVPLVSALISTSSVAGVVDVDPVLATSLIVGTTVLTSITEAIITTGEIRAQLPGSRDQLLFVDRLVVDTDRDYERDPSTRANIGIGAIGLYAAVDILLGSLQDRPDTAWEYLGIYLQSLGLTWSLTNIVKLAVRRPRPRAYQELAVRGEVSGGTQSALSFWSGHSAVAASIAATSVYLSFARDDPPVQKWLTLLFGVGVPLFVAGDRVDTADHFPTDVAVGLVMGGLIGVLVPHLSRAAPNLTISASPNGVGLGVRL